MLYKYDYHRLLGLITQFCGTEQNYANALNIGTVALRNRLQNKVPFTQNEILISKDIFNIQSAEDLDDIFFNCING